MHIYPLLASEHYGRARGTCGGRAPRATPAATRGVPDSTRVVRRGRPRRLRVTKVDRGGRSRGPRGVREADLARFSPIWGRFRGVRSVWRIGRAESRSTFVEFGFFRLCERLGLDFAPPRPPFGGSLALLGRSSGAPGRSLGAPVGPEGAFWGSSGAALGASWGSLGRSGAPLGLPMASWALWGPFWYRFRVDFSSISK